MTHPTLTRALAACQRNGSKAGTTAGMLRAIQRGGWGLMTPVGDTATPARARTVRIARITAPDVSRYTADARIAVGLRRLQDELRTVYPYAAPAGSWAGGDVRVSVSAGQPSASAWTMRVWSTNGKWSGNDLAVTLGVTERALLSGLDLTAGGLVVLDAEQIAPGEYRAAWAAQHGRLALKVVTGWLVRGYHSTRPTIEAARKEARASREKAISW